MAISEDTAALVAAQLTVAWALRAGPSRAKNKSKIMPEILAFFEAYCCEVTEIDERRS